ncbi:MAG TPA: DUF1549 and DUF1553 domain-containing protein [Planctomycetaceae bacterium]
MVSARATDRAGRTGRLALLLPLLLAPAAAVAAEGEITDAEREHWAFRPVVRPAVPAAGHAATPVDTFVLARLESQGLSLSPEADRRTLLRRLKLDLLGLPPTPEEVEAFVSDPAPDAYERVVERYLASPRYGERWGRHWLDLVRYADTDGYNADGDRPLAHRYRDYVVRAFNANLPYDRFVREQIAGDELYPESEDALVATGYLRLWPDEHNASDVHKARQDALNDITGNVGSVFLGLTIACAQCHDHKFDPILQTDYYELQAYFAGVLPQNQVPVGPADELRRYEKALAEWERQSDPVRSELYELEAGAKRKAGHVKRLKFPADVLEAIDTRPEDRTTRQRQLAWWAERQVDGEIKPDELEKHFSETERARREELRAKLAELERAKPQPPGHVTAMAVVDSPAGPAESYLLLTGSYDTAFDEVRPKGLTVLEPVSTAAEAVPVPRPGSSGRRAALAAWLTDPANPLPARVMVNRIWQGHFGKGLVEAANDFGVQTPEPTHPDLLDWLAAEFVDSGWDVKALHRLIVTSATYRQSSAIADFGLRIADSSQVDPQSLDPENTLLWHFPRRRLEAEAIRDSLLFVSGGLADEMYGPGVRPELPPGFTTGQAWKVTESPQDRNRRSVYVYAKRNLPHPFLAAFDLPDMFESCGGRVTTTTAPQALALLNDRQVLAAAETLAARLLATEDSLDPAPIVERAFRTALGRPPAAEEIDAALTFLREQERRAGEGESARAAAVTDLCHALLNANEFLYIE